MPGSQDLTLEKVIYCVLPPEGLYPFLFLHMGFPGDSVVKNLPANLETLLRSLGWEDPLEEGMATHSSTLAWRIPRTEEPGGLQSVWSQKSQT